MQGMLTGVVLLVLFAAAVALLPFAYAGWRRLVAREGELQIWRAMPRIGIAPEALAQREAMMAPAVRRCVMCPSIEECDHWLAAGQREGLGLFCPNATFFEQLKDAKAGQKR